MGEEKEGQTLASPPLFSPPIPPHHPPSPPKEKKNSNSPEENEVKQNKTKAEGIRRK